MLEDFIIPATAERLRLSVLGEHVEAFCARLAELRYRPTSIRDKLRTVSVLARWIADRGHAITDLDEAYVSFHRVGGRDLKVEQHRKALCDKGSEHVATETSY